MCSVRDAYYGYDAAAAYSKVRDAYSRARDAYSRVWDAYSRVRDASSRVRDGQYSYTDANQAPHGSLPTVDQNFGKRVQRAIQAELEMFDQAQLAARSGGRYG